MNRLPRKIDFLKMEEKWERSIGKLGIDPLMLSDVAGHA